MEKFIYILIGIFIWQTVNAIVTFVTDENEDICFPVSVGVWFFIVNFFGIIFYWFKAHFIYPKYNYYQFCNGKGDWLFNKYMTEKVATKYFKPALNLPNGVPYSGNAPYTINKVWDGKDKKFTIYCRLHKDDIITEKKAIEKSWHLNPNFIKNYYK